MKTSKNVAKLSVLNKIQLFILGVFVCFGKTMICTQGFVLAKQVLYHQLIILSKYF
jgi:hypothetical protein